MTNSKKFILIVEYGTGVIGMPTNECDLQKAIQEFVDKIKGQFGKDKGTILPPILSAKLINALYEKDVKQEAN